MGHYGNATAQMSLAEAQRRVEHLRRDLASKQEAYLGAISAYNKALVEYRRAMDAAPVEAA